jgi:adenosine kinase
LGLGGPVLDLIAQVDEEFLRRYDVVANQVTLAEERHLKLFDDLIMMKSTKFYASGATQNTIRVAQWMLGVPGATSFLGCIGKDEFGETMRQCSSTDGVNCLYAEVA